MFTCRLPVTLPIERVSPAVQLPSQADKNRRTVGPAAEPPWAALNCTASRRPHIAPSDARSVAAATAPRGAPHGGRFLQLRVSTLGRPRELRVITRQLRRSSPVARTLYARQSPASRASRNGARVGRSGASVRECRFTVLPGASSSWRIRSFTSSAAERRASQLHRFWRTSRAPSLSCPATCPILGLDRQVGESPFFGGE